MLHQAVMNPAVTPDIVRCLLRLHPGLAHICRVSWYPLHWACRNASCDAKIVELLVAINPDAVSHASAGGHLPLHWYLILKHNVATNTVRLLVDCHPEALMKADSDGGLPLHMTCDLVYKFLGFIKEI